MGRSSRDRSFSTWRAGVVALKNCLGMGSSFVSQRKWIPASWLDTEGWTLGPEEIQSWIRSLAGSWSPILHLDEGERQQERHSVPHSQTRRASLSPLLAVSQPGHTNLLEATRKTDDIKARPRSQPGKLRNSALVKGARQTKQTRLESEYTALSSKGIRKF